MERICIACGGIKSRTALYAALGPYGSMAEKVLAVSALENPKLTIEFR